MTVPSFLSSFSTMSLWSAASVFGKIRKVWKLYLWKELYLNPDHVLSTAAGLTCDFILDNPLFRLPALSFLAASRILFVFEQQKECNLAFDRWKKALLCHQPVNPCYSLVEKSTINFLFSRYSLTYYHRRIKCSAIRIQRVMQATLHLGWQIFKLIMRIVDFLELFTLESKKIEELSREAVRGSVFHTVHCLQTLSQHKTFIFSSLEKSKPYINRSLNFFGKSFFSTFFLSSSHPPSPLLQTSSLETTDLSSQDSTDKIINGIHHFFKVLDQALTKYQTLSTTTGEAAIDFAKVAIRGWLPDSTRSYFQLNTNSWWNSSLQENKVRRFITQDKITLCSAKKLKSFSSSSSSISLTNPSKPENHLRTGIIPTIKSPTKKKVKIISNQKTRAKNVTVINWDKKQKIDIK